MNLKGMDIKMEQAAIEYTAGLVQEGNAYSLQQVMKRAANGEAITVGFLGGSITQGCLSSTPETCYAYLVYTWWKKTFPKSQVSYVNAGIGATTSQFAVARVEQDLLGKQPDFVIVEFSVNDENTLFFQETYEGLIRHLKQAPKQAAIMIVNSVFYEDGHNAQQIHNEIGEKYGIPCVSMQSSIYPMIVDGRIERASITTDGLHPNDLGHRYMAEIIQYSLEYLKKKENPKPLAEQLPMPLTENRFEHSLRYQINNSTPACDGFTVDLEKQERLTDIFKNGWLAKEEGASIVFHIKAKNIAIQYRKTIQKPAPIASVSIDGLKVATLDGNFEETWGDCLYLQTVSQYLDDIEHEIKITIEESHKEDKLPFYLVAIITA